MPDEVKEIQRYTISWGYEELISRLENDENCVCKHTDVEKLEKRLATLTAQLAEASEENANLQRMNNGLYSEIGTLEKKLTESEKSNAELKGTLRQLNADLSSMGSSRNEYIQRYNEMETENRMLRDTGQELQDDYDKQKDAVAALIKNKEAVEHFLMSLADEGGYIVSSALCSEMELADARLHDRFFCIYSLGFVRRPDAATLPEIEKMRAKVKELEGMLAITEKPK